MNHQSTRIPMSGLSVATIVLSFSTAPLVTAQSFSVPIVGAVNPRECVDYATANGTGKSFAAGALWFAAGTNDTNGVVDMSGVVTVDWVRVFEIRSSGDTVPFDSALYDTTIPHHLGRNEGGLYSRPFVPNDNFDSFPNNDAEISNGCLVVNVGRHPRQFSHWWLPRKSIAATSRYFAEAMVKVEGNVSLQIGFDYWESVTCPDDASNNLEGWRSDWVNGSTYWNTIMTPQYTPLFFFTGVRDYGVTTKGDFYISKRFAEYGGWHKSGEIIEVYYWLTQTDNGLHPMSMKASGSDTIFVYNDTKTQLGITPVVYCFQFNQNPGWWLPSLAYKSGHIKNTADVIPNGLGGYNFQTTPVADLPTHAMHLLLGSMSISTTRQNNSRTWVNVLGRMISGTEPENGSISSTAAKPAFGVYIGTERPNLLVHN